MERRRFKDIAGKRFGTLVAKQMVGRDASGIARWLFACDCGVEKEINGASVRSGATVSCGKRQCRADALVLIAEGRG